MPAQRLIAALIMAGASSAAFAGPTQLAQDHFQLIAFGDIDHIMQQYANGAVLQWIGGPLNGTYFGPMQIRRAWKDFVHAANPGAYETSNVTVARNGDGETVTADVKFEGRKNIKVRYVLVYRKGKLVDEVWQIDPKLQFG